ncbi:MAG: hypothetical protein IAI50_12495, partial [Candidatus Eremiobacteraeota bacterium]|nr:hypothetical protein [Candidatus Eremiobacteraeota bacterium]
MKWFAAVAAGAFVTFAILCAAGFHATPYDNYVLLADAFRHGRVWIDWPGSYIDALPYAGRYYVIEAPLPALLLLPAVLVRGTAVSQSLLAALLGGLATFAGYEIARVLGVARRTTLLLCAFLLLGTDLFWCATFGDVWFVAHVAAVAFTLLAILELLGKRRGLLVALFAVCALESRFTMVLALPVYAGMLWFGTGLDPERDRNARASRQSLIAFAFVIAAAVPLWVWYNELRWGLPYDIGYTAWYHQDQAGEPSGSPFRLAYLPMQLTSFFVQYPDFRPVFPFLIPSIAGVALTWTSPALGLAFLVRSPVRLVAAMWLATALCAAPNFVYYVNGIAQFGMRHALDF